MCSRFPCSNYQAVFRSVFEFESIRRLLSSPKSTSLCITSLAYLSESSTASSFLTVLFFQKLRCSKLSRWSLCKTHVRRCTIVLFIILHAQGFWRTIFYLLQIFWHLISEIVHFIYLMTDCRSERVDTLIYLFGGGHQTGT